MKKNIEHKNKNIECNVLNVAFEIKQLDAKADDPDYFYFEGIAAMYGVVDHSNDVIQFGAFTESLKKLIPVILWQHMQDEPIGVIEMINDTPNGLFIRVKLPRADTLVSGRVIPQMKVGGVSKLSIGWITEEAYYDNDVRVITRGTLLEISIVTIPANDYADITGFKNRATKLHVDDLSFLDKLDKLDVKSLEKAFCESKLFSNDAAKKLAGCVSRASRESQPNSAAATDDNANKDETEALSEIKNLAKSLDTHAIKLELSKINTTLGAKQ